jgi:serine/threonine protein kinase
MSTGQRDEPPRASEPPPSAQRDDDVASARTLASAASAASPSAHPTHAYQRTREPRDSFEGEVLAGRYELGERLGAGGMGEVYRGRHLALDMPIAVKIMHPQISAVPEFATRFMHEARATSRIAHKNVVRILDFGADGGLHFIVMELLQGEPLSKRIRRRGYLMLAEVGDIMGQIFTGLEAVHAVSVVHRDLKPDNVFLARESDGTEVVKLVDFGLAHVDLSAAEQGEKLTKPDMVAGTPEYMSPEQCRSLDVGPSADLYAAGCILHELLALAPPFKGKTHMEVMTQQLFLPPPTIERPEEIDPLPPGSTGCDDRCSPSRPSAAPRARPRRARRSRRASRGRPRPTTSSARARSARARVKSGPPRGRRREGPERRGRGEARCPPPGRRGCGSPG